MRYEELKLNQKVYDTIFANPANETGAGVIKKILKTRVHVDFTHHGVEVYDLQHLQFLRQG